MKIGSPGWFKKYAPISSFEVSVGSTGWLDRRRQRDLAQSWIRSVPPLSKIREPQEEEQDEIKPELQ